MIKTPSRLQDIILKNNFVSNLPGDPNLQNFIRTVKSSMYSFVEIQNFPEAKTLSVSQEFIKEIGFESSEDDNNYLEQIFKNPEHPMRNAKKSYSMCYGGHQFGHWAGQLGDGRAISLGELQAKTGILWDLQVKGSGKTPYSRRGDGKAVLRSSVREYLASEGMFGLGISTTRALSLLTSGEMIDRDKLYNGNVEAESGALVIRASPSFVRFGNFEILSGQSFDLVKQLMNFEIERNFPEIFENILKNENFELVEDLKKESKISSKLFSNEELSKKVYLETFKEIAKRTAEMIVGWERVGFVHGVMNTDNMSILGLTIDYGPFGFMDFYDKDYTPNLTDHGSFRYKYSAQGKVGAWNLVKLLVCFVPLFGGPEPLQSIADYYMKHYDIKRSEMFMSKIGLRNLDNNDIVNQTLNMLETTGLDFTKFFISLEESFNYNGEISNDFDFDNIANQISDFIFVHSFDFREANGMIDSFLSNGIQVFFIIIL